MKKEKFIAMLVVVLFFGGISSTSFAQENNPTLQKELQKSQNKIKGMSSDLNEYKKLVDSLIKRIETLEKKKPSSGSEMEERIAEFEEQILELEERVGDRPVVHMFDGLKLDIGGFITQAGTVAIGKKGSKSSFNQNLVELLIKAQATENWSFFTALGFLREADLDLTNPSKPFFRDSANRVPQIIAWSNYRKSDAFEVQVGRFVTPMGIINMEHFPPTLLDLNQPQFLRPFPGSTIFPNFMNGVNVHGKKFLKNGTFNYNVFGGTFVGGSSNEFLGGFRLGLEMNNGYSYGLNYSTGTRTARTSPLGSFTTVPVKSTVSNSYHTFGLDLLYDKGKWIWKNELYYSIESGEDNRFTFYTQPGYRLTEKVTAFYRYDYLDPGQNLPVNVEHVLGINYQPIPTLRLRGEYIRKGFDASGADSLNVLQLSMTLSF